MFEHGSRGLPSLVLGPISVIFCQLEFPPTFFYWGRLNRSRSWTCDFGAKKIGPKSPRQLAARWFEGRRFWHGCSRWVGFRCPTKGNFPPFPQTNAGLQSHQSYNYQGQSGNYGESYRAVYQVVGLMHPPKLFFLVEPSRERVCRRGRSRRRANRSALRLLHIST